MPKPTSGRWHVEVHADKQSEWRPVGRSHWALSIVRAKFTPLTAKGERDHARPVAEMLIALDQHNVPEVYDMSLHAGEEPLTASMIRLPLRALVRTAFASSTFRRDGDAIHLVAAPSEMFVIEGDSIDVEHLAPERVAELERDAASRPRSNRVPDAKLDRVAEIVARVPYRERRRAVAAEFNTDLYEAKSLIALARRRGRLSRER